MASVPSTVVRVKTFRAVLSKPAHRNLDTLLGQLTWLWNVALNERRQAYERGTSVSRYDQRKTLTRTRQVADDDWQRFPVKAQRSVLARLDRAFAGFFRRVKAGEKPGFPRYKSENRGVRSFSMPCPKIRRNGKWSRVKIKGVGFARFRGMPDGDVKMLRIVRNARRTVIQFVCEIPNVAKPDTRPAIGLDLGINARVALSTGETFPGVKIDRHELKRRQRRVSRAKRGSRNRRKKIRMLAKEWQRVAEREKSALHELTTAIVRDVSANIVVERLNTQGMLRNGRLARSIAEQQWGRLVWMLSYKAESAGGQLVRVDPRFTSQDCSACEHRERIGLSVRVFRCQQCHHEQDRDVNAANNVLQKGMPSGGATPRRANTNQSGGDAASA